MMCFYRERAIGCRGTAVLFRQGTVRAVIRSLLVVVAMASATLSARGEEELPSQDQALARALESHPEIVAAKARVSLAEAELYGKRMEVSRQVLDLYGSLKMLDAQIKAVKTSLEQAEMEYALMKERVGSGAGDNLTNVQAAGAVRAAEVKLVEAVGRREQAEKELRLLVGNAAPKTLELTFNTSEAAGTARQRPQSLAINKWKVVEEKPIKLEFADVPLVEVLHYLSAQTGVMFSMQGPALAEQGIEETMPVTLTTNEVPLSAALQSFEDAISGLQFVLRDYGVLLRTKEYAEDRGYVPVLELDVESAAAVKSR
jgi:hypothetical protein